jgi:hypothetical protein
MTLVATVEATAKSLWVAVAPEPQKPHIGYRSGPRKLPRTALVRHRWTGHSIAAIQISRSMRATHERPGVSLRAVHQRTKARGSIAACIVAGKGREVC